MTTTVSVRMYNVGFGDAFLITVTRDEKHWRALIDCGVHSHGQARPIAETVKIIIADLAEASPDGVPHLDVVAATHHHADHISGFAVSDWAQVQVGEVWVPFVEDVTDADAHALKARQVSAAQRLLGLIETNPALAAAAGRGPVALAKAFAVNSSGNAAATDRLLGRNGLGFATTPRVRYLPDRVESENLLQTGLEEVQVHILGPSRAAADLKKMDPPKRVAWLQLDGDDSETGPRVPEHLFASQYEVQDLSDLPDELRQAGSIKITMDDEILAAASVLERSVNNTSLFFVLDVAGTRLIFCGDSQHGAWQHVLTDPAKLALLQSARFYKVGHHGSGNATPKEFIEQLWPDGGWVMLPWGLVKQWEDTIPQKDLMDAMDAHHHTVIRADQAPEPNPAITIRAGIWSQLTLTVE
jgi:beta-lactamase superfamily II metal-dependent hydrolase